MERDISTTVTTLKRYLRSSSPANYFDKHARRSSHFLATYVTGNDLKIQHLRVKNSRRLRTTYKRHNRRVTKFEKQTGLPSALFYAVHAIKQRLKNNPKLETLHNPKLIHYFNATMLKTKYIKRKQRCQ